MAVRILGLIFSFAFSIACGMLGFGASKWYLDLPLWISDATLRPIYGQSFVNLITVAFVALGLLVGFSIASFIYRQLATLAANLVSVPAADKVAVSFGLMAGLVVARLISPLLPYEVFQRPMIYPALITLLYLLCVYGGIMLALSMKTELSFLLTRPGRGEAEAAEVASNLQQPKLLDTSVIIDGRIADICRTGFVEGALYIPGFVLEELQLVADSSDGLRRARGRRGLDILAQLQKDLHKRVKVYDRYKTPMPRGEAVDAKLVRLAKELSASIITNDFNLNKVASLQGITVLNVNELASALRPIVLPGEEMTVTIVREGKELNQGVAYLDDGTMVVVEGGKQRINETLPVIVSSVLQTVAGKMIFAGVRSSGEDYGESDNYHRGDRLNNSHR
jgi:uncharacterized protein YacL